MEFIFGVAVCAVVCAVVWYCWEKWVGPWFKSFDIP